MAMATVQASYASALMCYAAANTATNAAANAADDTATDIGGYNIGGYTATDIGGYTDAAFYAAALVDINFTTAAFCDAGHVAHNFTDNLAYACLLDTPDAPAQNYTQQTLTKQTFAEQTFAGQTFAEQTFAGQTFAEQTFAEQTFAEQTFAEQTFAEQTFAEQTFAASLHASLYAGSVFTCILDAPANLLSEPGIPEVPTIGKVYMYVAEEDDVSRFGTAWPAAAYVCVMLCLWNMYVEYVTSPACVGPTPRRPLWQVVLMGENYINMFGARRVTPYVESQWKAQTGATCLDADGNVQMSALRSCIENEVILLPLGQCSPEL